MSSQFSDVSDAIDAAKEREHLYEFVRQVAESGGECPLCFCAEIEPTWHPNLNRKHIAGCLQGDAIELLKGKS